LAAATAFRIDDSSLVDRPGAVSGTETGLSHAELILAQRQIRQLEREVAEKRRLLLAATRALAQQSTADV